jgi:hypothetical protein
VIAGSQGATVDGTVNNDHQEAVIGGQVVLMSNSSRRPTKVATTDQQGWFAIRGIPSGDYQIFAWDNVEPNAYFDPSFLDHYASQGTPLHLDANGHATSNLNVIPVP